MMLYDIELMWRKTIKEDFSIIYSLVKHGFLTNKSARRVLSILKTSIMVHVCDPMPPPPPLGAIRINDDDT